MKGREGSDTYLFMLGDGQDTIEDYARYGTAATDRIVRGGGLTPERVKIGNAGEHLVISLLDESGHPTGDVLTAKLAYTDSKYRIEELEYGDGTVLDAVGIMAEASKYVEGTESDDTLSGNGYDNIILGFGGADTLTVGVGNDTLHGGEGDDTLLTHENAASWTTMQNYANTFWGGPGNDVMKGREGADTYLSMLGDGQDTIEDYARYGTTAKDRIVLGEGLTPERVIIGNAGAHLVIRLLDELGQPTGDVLTAEHAYTDSKYRIEELEYGDGTVLNTTALMVKASEYVNGTEADDTLSGNGYDNIILGLDGADTLNSGSGDDRLEGGEGEDTITGDAGNNTLHGGEGNDTLQINESAASWTTMKEFHNTLWGGLGNDVMKGREGSDTYLFMLGDGQDTIEDYARYGTAATDRIVLGEGLTPERVKVGNAGDHLVISLLDASGQPTGDVLTAEWAYTNSKYRIEELEYGDGTVLDAAALIFEASKIVF